jgi:GAF domain-containing protein
MTRPAASSRADSARVRLERLGRLQALTAELSAAAAPEDVARIIFDRGLSLVGARVVTLHWEQTPGELELVYGLGVSEEFVQRYRRIGPDTAIPSGEVYRTGEPVWLGTLEAIRARFPEAGQLAAAEGDQAWAAFPLLTAGPGDRSRGSLGLRFDQPRAFDPEERDFVMAVARHCAQALERARLFEDQRRLADRLGSLQAITSELSAALTPREVSAVVFRHLHGVGASGGIIFTLSASDGLEPLFVHEADDLRAALARVSADGAAPHADALRAGEPRWLDSPAAVAAAYPELEPLRASRGDGAWSAIPLRVEGRSVGVLALAFPQGRAPGPEDRSFVLALAGQGAQALERSRLFEAQRRLAERLGRLHSTASALSGAATPRDVAAAAFGALGALGASGADIYALEGPERLTLLARQGGPAGQEEALHLDAAAPAAEVVRTGKALWLESPEELAARYPDLAARRAAHGEGAWAVVPLLAAGSALGSLAVAFPAPHRFEAEEKSFVRMLAMPCAQALERARLFETASHNRREAEWLAALLDGALAAAPVGLALLDRDMRVVRSTGLFARLSGFPLDTQRGRTPIELFPGFPAGPLADAFRRVIATGERVDHAISGEIAGAGGETRRYALSWYPVSVARELAGAGLLIREVPLSD